MGRSIIDVEASCMNLRRLCEEKGYSVKEIQTFLKMESCQAVYSQVVCGEKFAEHRQPVGSIL